MDTFSFIFLLFLFFQILSLFNFKSLDLGEGSWEKKQTLITEY